MPSQDHPFPGPRGVCCEVAAFAVARLAYDEAPAVRRRPEPLFGPGLPASFLKHVDEQTLVGLVAVFQAVRHGSWTTESFREWGILAAPHFFGQPHMAASLLRFQAEGAWGVSPHVIPHHSLHSLSGTVSQALKIHGPNLGVGGGPGATGEALLTAAAWIERCLLPGVWVVVSTLEPHSPLAPDGEPPPGTTCVGLALALTPPRPDSVGLRLRLAPGEAARRSASLDLFRLQAALEQGRAARGTGTLVVAEAAPRLELEWGRAYRPLPPARSLLLKAGEARRMKARLSTAAETQR